MVFYHTKSIQESFDLLNSSDMGLTSEEVKRRKEHHGSNIMPEPKEKSLFSLMLDQFKSPIIYVLLVAAFVSFIIGEFTDAYFIMAVLLVNAVIGFFQEYSAGKKANALKNAIKTFTYVLRDGVKQEIDSQELTLSDIILLESGSKVPADIRLVEANDLKVNEALLTGESLSIQKDPHFITDDEELAVGDRKNMLYAGSYVESGRGMGVVCGIGKDTQVGKIATLLAGGSKTKSPLIMRMETFSINIAKIIGI
ncbi:MAG: cation-transporting P-type ATPase, partial [Thiovulaceae bacterium]|nr:cation-transporting P-type ATPase [Sulfurimonadaceae bacterium]